MAIMSRLGRDYPSSNLGTRNKWIDGRVVDGASLEN